MAKPYVNNQKHDTSRGFQNYEQTIHRKRNISELLTKCSPRSEEK